VAGGQEIDPQTGCRNEKNETLPHGPPSIPDDGAPGSAEFVNPAGRDFRNKLPALSDGNFPLSNSKTFVRSRIDDFAEDTPPF
jgi:hypothetical protein